LKKADVQKNVASTMTTKFFNIPRVQAGVHDFYYFIKNFEKSGKILVKKADV
jgi:hypothetical protein